MATRKVLQEGDPTLRKKSKPVKDFDDDLDQLLDDMKETMHENNGMGLAAVQVGVLRRVVIVEANGMFVEFVNPEIVKTEGEDIDTEGCLSVGKFEGRVKRPYKVTVRAFDRYGYPFEITGEKYFARCICHEVDHLNGILFIDKCENRDEYFKARKGQ